MLPYLTALRPRQWTKNLIVFAAPLFAFQLTPETIGRSVLAFILFCAVSSSFYLLNDWVDYEADRVHPIKRDRPIASGQVKRPIALGLAIVLILTSLSIAILFNPLLAIALMLYAAVQIAYNLRLKQVPILDLFSITSGFVLRAYGGAIVNTITLSSWFVLCSAMLALFLAIEKRKAELRLHLKTFDGAKPTRKVLQYYSLPLLDRMETVVTTTTVMSYALWSSGPQLKGASTSWMLITLPFVIYGIFRYQMISDDSMISEGDRHSINPERPEEVLLRDRPILLTVIGWALCCGVILLLKSQGILG